MNMSNGAWRFLTALVAAICMLLAPACLAKELLVDASTQSMCVALTEAGENGGPPESLIFSRAMGNNQWQQLYQVASPILSLTHQEGESAILLTNGQWMFVYQDGRSLGTDVPGGQLAQITGNGRTIYGAAWIDGGLAGLSASSRPASAPSSRSKLVLLAYQRGQWQGLAEIPSVPPNAEISMAANERNLLIAWPGGKNQLQVSRYSLATGLQALPPVSTTFEITDFKALYGADQPIVWIAPANGPGCISKWDGKWGTLISLPNVSTLAKAQHRDICVDADQQLRLVYGTTDQLFEQNYNLRGAAVGSPSEILSQQEDNDTGSTRWLGLAFVMLLVFMVLGAFRRQPMTPPPAEQGPAIVVASLPRRLGAGIVDLLPYFITGIAVVIPITPPIVNFAQAMRVMNQPAVRNPMMIALAVYLLHTTLGELFFARSIGKYIFGLKLINLRGQRPSVAAVLLRNVFRLVDLWLFFVMILISPRRQRIGDLIGGTLVVLAKTVPPEKMEPSEEKPA